jgi:regulatory protein
LRNLELKQSSGCGRELAGESEREAFAPCDKELARARNAAYRFLTYRPRSSAEVEERLLEKGFTDVVVRTVFTDLVRLGYINDHEFARQWAAARIRLQGFGRRRIERELRAKGIGREIIAEVLATAVSEDIERRAAREAAQKKLKTLQSADRQSRRRRLAGFLERKGFSYDVIRVVLTDADEIQSAVL